MDPLIIDQKKEATPEKRCVGMVLGFELRARQILLSLEPLHQSFLVMGFFKIGSFKLFPWAGFEP
jgi:hypothetical protein